MVEKTTKDVYLDDDLMTNMVMTLKPDGQTLRRIVDQPQASKIFIFIIQTILNTSAKLLNTIKLSIN